MKDISNYRLAEIIATITELSKEKKRDLYNFLIGLKDKSSSADSKAIKDIYKLISQLNESIKGKVDKDGGKGLSTNDFTDELRNKLSTIVGNVRSNWAQNDKTKGDYILNKPNFPSSSELQKYELKSNKVNTISSQSTDKEYPSAKCVYQIVGNIEAVLNNILGN